jgi:hypothetical protein
MNLQSVVQTNGANFQQKKPMNFRGLRRSGGLDSSSGKHATDAIGSANTYQRHQRRVR